MRASHGDLTRQIAVDDVLFFRADDKYTCVQTAEAEHLIRTPIGELANQLDPARFVQVHRSTIVNLDHLGPPAATTRAGSTCACAATSRAAGQPRLRAPVQGDVRRRAPSQRQSALPGSVKPSIAEKWFIPACGSVSPVLPQACQAAWKAVD